MYKKGGLTNVWTLLLITVIVVVFSFIIVNGASNLKSPTIALSSSSQTYISNISGANKYNLTAMPNDNSSMPKDPTWSFALSFLEIQRKADTINQKINSLFTLPSYLVGTLLQVPIAKGSFLEITLSAISWLIGIAVFLAIIYLIWK